jgi:PKD repeat protein
MKTLKNFILIVAFFGTLQFSLNAQTTTNCRVDSINISTGIDNSGTVQPTGSIVQNWTLISGPGGGTYPTDAYTISTYSAWSTPYPGSNWISTIPGGSNSVNNQVPYIFQRCFCVKTAGRFRIRMNMLVDDGAIVNLDGSPILSAMVGWQFLIANAAYLDTVVTLSAGRHCLDFNLYNTGGVAMGIDIRGMLTPITGELISDACCSINPNPDPCSARADFNSTHVGGTFNFTNTSLGSTLVSTHWDFGDGTTSADNNPTHTYATPGEYTVCLFIITTGADGSTCCDRICKKVRYDEACVADPQFTFAVNAAGGIDFTNTSYYNTSLHTITWQFGDGTTSNLPNPSHTFAPGTYTVCLFISAEYNGTYCCNRICRTITISQGGTGTPTGGGTSTGTGTGTSTGTGTGGQ